MIFISYRRAEADDHAGRLIDRLHHWYDADALSYDKSRSSIDMGDDFPAEIEAGLERATVVLVLIGPKWLEEINGRVAEHPNTLSSMNNLASTLKVQGDLPAARALEDSVLAVRRRVLGEEHPDTLNSAAHLADSLWQAGERVVAADQMRAAADGLARVLGADHPNTIGVRKAAEAMEQALAAARGKGRRK